MRIPQAIRAARVDALKRAVAEGRYHINSEQIAERMLDEARETLRSRVVRD